jgi:hypothetical protein
MEDYKMNELKTTYEIKFPKQITYFIAYTDNLIFAYGSITPEQEMTTGQPYLWTTTDESDWIHKLETDFNIKIDNNMTF